MRHYRRNADVGLRELERIWHARPSLATFTNYLQSALRTLDPRDIEETLQPASTYAYYLNQESDRYEFSISNYISGYYTLWIRGPYFYDKTKAHMKLSLQVKNKTYNLDDMSRVALS